MGGIFMWNEVIDFVNGTGRFAPDYEEETTVVKNEEDNE
jgi:hypothetical protein